MEPINNELDACMTSENILLFYITWGEKIKPAGNTS